jgi:hypothetical protein
VLGLGPVAGLGAGRNGPLIRPRPIKGPRLGARVAVDGHDRRPPRSGRQAPSRCVRLYRINIYSGQISIHQRRADHPLPRRPIRRAVNPFEAPSWLTADPRTTTNTWWPLRWASDNRSMVRQALTGQPVNDIISSTSRCSGETTKSVSTSSILSTITVSSTVKWGSVKALSSKYLSGVVRILATLR